MFVAKRSVVKTGRPLKMAAELHPRSGKLIGLSNSNRTARRNQPVQEFNHGLVLSKEPLRDRDVFTVRIDKKVNKSSRPLAPLLLPGALAGRTAGEALAERASALPLSAVESRCYHAQRFDGLTQTLYDAVVQGSHRLECQRRTSRSVTGEPLSKCDHALRKLMRTHWVPRFPQLAMLI